MFNRTVVILNKSLSVLLLSIGSSTATARGAYCAGKQDKFREFYNLAYEKPVTKTLKLDQQAFTACVTPDDSVQFVLDSNQLARDLGVTGTPTFFVDG